MEQVSENSGQVSNRRKERSTCIYEALHLQLAASAKRARFSSMVLSDDLGLVVASYGNPKVSEHIAALSPKLAMGHKTWHGRLKTNRGDVLLSVAPIRYNDTTLYLSATEGTGAVVPKELFTSGQGVLRILA